MKEALFEQLLGSVKEGGKLLRGEASPTRVFVTDGPNIKRIRAKYDLSQDQFAALLGISVATLRNWEQGRREPEGPARVLLQVAARHPDAVWDVVRPASARKGSTKRLAKPSRRRSE
jgi:putative transcriptional regulator